LGNSAGSVHKKIRCPRCLNSFKTASAVVKHLKANSSQCVQPSILSQEMQQSSFHQDDISEETWSKIDEQISRKEFNKLDLSKQTVIDHWVLANLDNQKPQQDEKRKWDLRKWNMTWRILFPNYDVPSSPCKFLSMVGVLYIFLTFASLRRRYVPFNDKHRASSQILQRDG
jgi:hypothetical protein